ncbi:septal ring lytic transglycosylase RlpA family protein [Blastomonas sp. AAP53]|uniref:septal ring lytic transglycosylase RlpA family protein n=1 Tax=Blastomonas sp. AAP53 TaxID=1248760 RepID=UPI0002E5A7C0|nr:septal ring lytic transglycosylase RlpA family protein [Blastomonas sp. AAP53]
MKTWMIASAGATALLLSGCGGGSNVSRSLDTAPPQVAGSVADYPVKLGEPYELGGITYIPVDVFNYDEAGYASWYGKELNGRNTANGELFNPDGITGAHRTLPLPSYVEVTALDTGKTILVRLNDRGPAASNRLIDLSYGAARQLGVLEKGAFPVRVRRVNPPEAERAMLRTGQPVAMRMDTPESLLVPLRLRLEGKDRPSNTAAAPVAAPVAAATPPAATPGKPGKLPRPAKTKPVSQVDSQAATAQPVPATRPAPQPPRAQSGDRFIVEGGPQRPVASESNASGNRPSAASTPSAQPAAASASYFVQVAAFSSKARADELAKRIGAKAQPSGDGKIFRVRYGPYPSADAAQQGVTLAKRNGYQGARIQQDSGR